LISPRPSKKSIMNCIIVDDDSTSRFVIRKLSSITPILKVSEEFFNAEDALEYLKTYEGNVVFLNPEMTSFSEDDYVKSLKKPPKIIYTTSKKELITKITMYPNVVDYLVKPIKEEDFMRVVHKLLDSSKEKGIESLSEKLLDAQVLFVNVNRRLVKINFSEINVVEAKGDYIQIKTDSKNLMVHSTLKKIEEKLPNNLFLKVHRSYVINLSKIVDVEHKCVSIRKEIVPVSRSNRRKLIKRLNLL